MCARAQRTGAAAAAAAHESLRLDHPGGLMSPAFHACGSASPFCACCCHISQEQVVSSPLLLTCAGPNKWLWVIGFLINLVFSFLAALGINLQKHSLRLHENEQPRPPPFQQKVYILYLLLECCPRTNIPLDIPFQLL